MLIYRNISTAWLLAQKLPPVFLNHIVLCFQIIMLSSTVPSLLVIELTVQTFLASLSRPESGRPFHVVYLQLYAPCQHLSLLIQLFVFQVWFCRYVSSVNLRLKGTLLAVPVPRVCNRNQQAQYYDPSVSPRLGTSWFSLPES